MRVAKVSRSKEYGIQRQGLPIGDAAKPHIFSAVLWVRLLDDLCTSFQILPPLLNSPHDFSLLVNCSQRLYTLCPPLRSKLLHRGAFKQSKLLHRASFYTEQLLHRETFTDKKLLHRASSYTEKLLHRETFNTDRGAFTQSKVYTDNLLHKGAFTQRSFYAEAFTRRSFYTEKLLHKEAFTQRSFYTKPAFTQWNFNLHGNRNYNQNRASAPTRKNDDFWSAFYNKGIL